MGLFKLKVGSAVTGSGETMRFYDANDPLRNIVDTGEGGQDLARIHPEKFEKYEGPPQPLRDEMRIFGEVNPPPPPTDAARAEAELLRLLTQGGAIERAQKLREMADLLEQRARGDVKVTPQAAEAMKQAQQSREKGEPVRSVSELFGQHETAQFSEKAEAPPPPERSQSPIPQDQSSLSPEKQKQLSEAVEKERAEGKQRGEYQREALGQPDPPPQTPGANPEQRARETQAQIGQSSGSAGSAGQQGQQQKPQGQQPQQGGQQPQQQPPVQQPPQGQPPQGTQKPMSKGQVMFKSLAPDRQRQEDTKLDAMNATQLRALAEEEEVEVPQNASRAQMIQAIRQARKG